MPDESLVTVARCDTRGAAQLVKTKLEDAGIPSMLSNEEQAGLAMPFDPARSGVQVRVAATQAEEAQALLRDE